MSLERGTGLRPIEYQCCPHTETSQLMCRANQLTGFYMRVTLALNGLIEFLILVKPYLDICNNSEALLR